MHPMKKHLIILAASLITLAVRAALPQPDLIASIHFAGGDKVAADKNYPAFANEFSSPEALALRKQIADKLAPWLAKTLNPAVADGGSKLRPLLEDVQNPEWFFESRVGQGGQLDSVLVIKLDSARAQIWQTELAAFLPAASFRQSAGWLVFTHGSGAQKIADALTLKISLPSTNWLTLDVNWPRLAQWHPQLKELGLPETAFEIAADKTDLLVRGKFSFPEKLAIKTDAWRIPTNTMHQPLISFTAARGLVGWLKTQPWGQAFAVETPTDQAFIWAIDGTPFQTFAAVPVPDSSAALQQFTSQMQPVVAERNAQDGFMSAYSLATSNTQTTLKGTPIVTPYAKAVREKNGAEFLFLGAFPNLSRSKPLPPELFQRLSTPGLVFYHWEVTSNRVSALSQFSQLALMLTRHKQISGDSLPFKWMTKAARSSGSSVTEITQTAPDELTFKRRAPTGLTAFEIVALANWMDASDFPGCTIALPPPTERQKQIRARRDQQMQKSPQVISIPAPPAPSKP
jgi:hypothetical protein